MRGSWRPPDASALGLFGVAVLIGGSNFVAIRYSNRELEPFWGAALRFGLAALVFVVAALALRLPWPRGRLLVTTLVYGVLAFAVSYALLYWALGRTTAAVAAVVMASTPLITLLLATAQGIERPTIRTVVGALTAIAGIAWMALADSDVSLSAGAFAALLGAAGAAGQSVILGKKVSANHPAMTNAVGMTAGSLVLLAASALSGEAWAAPRALSAVLAVAYLVVLGSVGLFVVVLLVVRRWTASASSYVFVLFPVVALVVGALVAGEAVTSRAIVGAVLVMAGVWVGALSPGARRVSATRVVGGPQATPGT